jgi:hypothetical protein
MTTVEFYGEQFRIADRIGLMPMMRFAKAAKSGVDSNDLDGLAAMYDLLEQCLADDEWPRFEKHADRHRADGDELMEIVSKVFEVLSERPTQRPSDSSDGPSTTTSSSTAGSSSRALRQLDGRPDLQVAVLRAQEARAS